MNKSIWIFSIATASLALGLPIFSYLDHMYRNIGRVSTGRLRHHLDIFESEIEPLLRLPRKRAALTFNILADVWLALVVLETARGVIYFVSGTWEGLIELFVFLGIEVAVGMHFVPGFLLTRTTGRWLRRLIPVLRASAWLVWPLCAVLELAMTVARISEDEPVGAQGRRNDNEGIEALVEAAEEEGILQPDEADLIEQVVEFSDKSVREVMTARPDIVAVEASASVEQLRRVLVETRFSRLPVIEGSLEEIIGTVDARDILQIPEREATNRLVRELARPALFVPETKLGSELLREIRHKNLQMVIVVDEYGSVSGLATLEDLVEEIVGPSGGEPGSELGKDDYRPAPAIIRENDGSMVLRGSVSLAKLREIFDIEFAASSDELPATVAGLLNLAAGHVPAAGERVEHDGLQFEILEANQRKVLRVRARRLAASSARRT